MIIYIAIYPIIIYIWRIIPLQWSSHSYEYIDGITLLMGLPRVTNHFCDEEVQFQF